MGYQANVEDLQSLTLTTDMSAICDDVKLMLQLGYLGTVTFEAGPIARISFTRADAVPISAATGDTILYRTAPAAAVVKCVTAEQLASDYHPV